MFIYTINIFLKVLLYFQLTEQICIYYIYKDNQPLKNNPMENNSIANGVNI